MGLKRRDFIKWGGVSLLGVGLQAPKLLSSDRPGQSVPSSLYDQLLNEEFPFPYDDQVFLAAERIYNVRRTAENPSTFKTDLNLLLKQGKRLDVKVYASDRKENLSQAVDVQSFTGVEGSLDVQFTAGDSPRLYYQVQYREGQGGWKALSPKSFRLPNADLQKGGQVRAVFIADDHNFDDGDCTVPEAYKTTKITGDYVNEILKALRTNPQADPGFPLNKLMNGFYLAKAIRHILNYEDPDFVVLLGDTTGIGSSYRWKAWGLPDGNLTEADRDYIAKTLWLRTRKIYSGLTPNMPVYIAMGNHDGEEGWNSLRFRSKEWRTKYFPLPVQTTYPEGGHPDGNFYAFSWGSDQNNEGGVQFIVLDVMAFCGEVEPKTIFDWTLGKDQLSWLEEVLSKSDKDWNFACYHHVLGGWPAGPGETDSHIAYGRGALFTAADYQKYGDPNRIEQVKITEWANKYGLRGFIYGHDHIFKVKKIGLGGSQKDPFSVCCGSTKYVGEKGWWQGSLWTQHYGNGLKSNPDFWGPSGITRLTLKNEEARVDYVLTGYTTQSNLPGAANDGATLSSTIFANPLPSIQVDKPSFVVQIQEGRSSPAPQILKIRNGGGRLLNYQVRPKQDWIKVSPDHGRSWSAWKDVAVSFSTRHLKTGNYEGSIIIESAEATNNPLEVRLQLEVRDPQIYPPLDFSGVRKEWGVFAGSDSSILLTWKGNRLNLNIRKYRIYWYDELGRRQVLAELKASVSNCTFKNAKKDVAYRFAIAAVDVKNREGEAACATVGKSLLSGV